MAKEARVAAEDAKVRTELEAARAIEETQKKAMESFKASNTFQEEVIEGSSTSYIYGFDDCNMMVARLFPDLDLSGVTLDSKEEVEEGEILIEEETQPTEADSTTLSTSTITQIVEINKPAIEEVG